MKMKLQERFVLQSGECCTFLNPFSLGVVSEELDQRECERLRFYTDGIAIVLYARLFKNKRVERVSFDDTSIAPVVFGDAVTNHLRVCLVGGTPENIVEATRLLKEKYPGLQIVLSRSGYFDSEQERTEFLDQAMISDVLIVGMGAGKQERILLDMQDKGWSGSGYTCGGYLDQLVQAKGGDYYPDFIDRYHLRWLYRILKEPRRLVARYFVYYPYYLLKFGKNIG